MHDNATPAGAPCAPDADAVEIGNPILPVALTADGFTQGPMPGSLLPCGCHIRRPDYEAILCGTHLSELNAPSPSPA